MAGPLSWTDEPDGDEPPVRIGLHRVRIALVRPHRSAHHTVRDRESILVRWERSDGHVGWGECPTLVSAGYATETTDQAWAALVDRLLPEALASGRVAADPARPAACGALRDARLDARLRVDGVGLGRLVGAPATLPGTGVVASVGDDPTDVAAAALAVVATGSAMVKVKVVPATALEVVDAVLDAVGPVPLALDANGSFEPGEHDGILARLLAAPLRYLEQPFGPSVPQSAWSELAARGGVPLAVDESATSVEAVRGLVLDGACSVVSIKPARLGGLAAAARAASELSSLGASCFVGGMFELGVGRSSALRLAGAPWFDLPTDLGPSARYVALDVTEPVVDDAGRLVVPDGPGCALHPVPERLTAAEVERVEIVRR